MDNLTPFYQQAGAYVKYLYEQGKQFPYWSEERAKFWHRSKIYFINEFIRPELPMPDFHLDWCYWMVSEPSYINLSSRLHAKTSLHAIYRPVWELCCDPTLRFVIAAKKAAIAEDTLSAIKGYLALDRIVIGFGQLNPGKLPEEERLTQNIDWSMGTITVNRDERINPIRGPSVVTVGALSSVLSVRAERLIADDIVDSAIAESETQCSRLLNWYDNDLLPVLVPQQEGGQEIIVGTPYNNRDLYAMKRKLEKNTQNPDGVYKVFVGDAIVSESEKTTLWPEKWPYEELMKVRAKLGSVRFNRNYRCRIMSDEDSTFPMIWFTGGTSKEGVVYPGCFEHDRSLGESVRDNLYYRRVVIGIDPAMSQSARSAFFAACVLGTDRNGNIVVLDLRQKKIGFVQQKRLVVNLDKIWNPRAIVVENNAYQAALAQGLTEVAPHLRIVPKTTTGKDTIHIPSMDVYFETGRVRLPRGDARSIALTDRLVEELNQWPRGATSDLLMAFYFALMRLLKYAPALQELPNPRDLIFGDMERFGSHLVETEHGNAPGRTLRRVREMAKNAPIAVPRDYPLLSVVGLPDEQPVPKNW